MAARVHATYHLDTAVAPERAADIIAGEQSSGTFVPIPGEDEALKARAAASWEITPLDETSTGQNKRYQLRLSWPLENFGASLPNLMTTVAGNLYELKPVAGLRLMDIELPDEFAAAYPGPAFGIAGTRQLAGVPEGPLVGTIIKPSVGLSAAAIPPGCANSPPPARKIKSVDCNAAQVPGACLMVCPDENTGITVHGLCANIGVRQARADAITLSSLS